MRIKLDYLTPLLVAGAAAAAIAAAPSAAAAAPVPVQQSCDGSSSETVCELPGNAQLTASPPYVDSYAEFPYYYGYYGGYGHGVAGGGRR